MEHSLDTHLKNLNDLCRCCGYLNYTLKQKKHFKKPSLVTKQASDILLIFDICVANDKDDKHSKYVCNTCINKIRHGKNKRASAITSARKLKESSEQLWCEYRSDADCNVCRRRIDVMHVLNKNTKDNSLKTEEAEAIDINDDNIIEVKDSHQDEILQSFNNKSILVDSSTSPLKLSEVHAYKCVIQTSVGCSTSTSPLKIQRTSTPIKPLVTEISTSPMLKSDEFLSISDTLKKSVEMPVTKKEERIYKSVTKRKLFQSPQHEPIKCKTGGQPIYLMKVTNPRRSSKKCVRETRFKRTKEIDSIRQNIAGPSTYDADKQLSTEIQTLAKKRKLHIKENEEIIISDKTALSMKEELGLSWRQEGKHRKIMKKMGIKIKGDAAVRKLSKTIVTDFVQADMTSFVVEQKEKKAVLGYINNLQALIINLLDSYDEEGMLTWHDNTIPQDEIWVKLGGDHGKNSLKLTLQIANLEKPNAKRNVVVIGMAPIRDTYENLKTMINFCQLEKEIKSVESLTWKNKKIVFLLTGDYEFLTKMYGLSGAAGTFPCLWCLIPRKQLHSVKPNASVARSLEDLKTQNGIFVRDYKEDKKEAARCYNCIQLPLLDISLNNICPPYLHILLGLVKKHHTLLEDAMN